MTHENNNKAQSDLYRALEEMQNTQKEIENRSSEMKIFQISVLTDIIESLCNVNCNSKIEKHNKLSNVIYITTLIAASIYTDNYIVDSDKVPLRFKETIHAYIIKLEANNSHRIQKRLIAYLQAIYDFANAAKTNTITYKTADDLCHKTLLLMPIRHFVRDCIYALCIHDTYSVTIIKILTTLMFSCTRINKISKNTIALSEHMRANIIIALAMLSHGELIVFKTLIRDFMTNETLKHKTPGAHSDNNNLWPIKGTYIDNFITQCHVKFDTNTKIYVDPHKILASGDYVTRPRLLNITNDHEIAYAEAAYAAREFAREIT